MNRSFSFTSQLVGCHTWRAAFLPGCISLLEVSCDPLLTKYSYIQYSRSAVIDQLGEPLSEDNGFSWLLEFGSDERQTNPVALQERWYHSCFTLGECRLN